MEFMHKKSNDAAVRRMISINSNAPKTLRKHKSKVVSKVMKHFNETDK
jgi:hypothetical protein